MATFFFYVKASRTILEKKNSHHDFAGCFHLFAIVRLRAVFPSKNTVLPECF